MKRLLPWSALVAVTTVVSACGSSDSGTTPVSCLVPASAYVKALEGAPGAVRLAETLLPGVPVSRAALAAYEAATAIGPDDDEGKMIEIVSRPK